MVTKQINKTKYNFIVDIWMPNNWPEPIQEGVTRLYVYTLTRNSAGGFFLAPVEGIWLQ